jgi:hypothetical protein
LRPADRIAFLAGFSRTVPSTKWHILRRPGASAPAKITCDDRSAGFRNQRQHRPFLPDDIKQF